MALSNWDTLAFNEHGKPNGGSLILKTAQEPKSTRIGFTPHPKMWHKGCGFNEPTIASINSGDIVIGGLKIHAKRHKPQDAIFVYVTETYAKEGKTTMRMCGIGASGYMSEFEWLRRNHPDFLATLDPRCKEETFFCTGYQMKDGKEYRTIDFLVDDSRKGPDAYIEVPIPFDSDDRWIGVEQSTVDAFKIWLKEVADKEYFESIDFDNALRFNQGDAYFAGHLGDDFLQATKVGEQVAPIIAKLVRGHNAKSSGSSSDEDSSRSSEDA